MREGGGRRVEVEGWEKKGGREEVGRKKAESGIPLGDDQ